MIPPGTPWTQRADLGHMELALRAIGLATWLFLGLSRLAPGPRPAWVWPWLGYGLAFAIASVHTRLPLWLARAALAVQALCVLPLPHLGFGGFEGLLLSIVAVQVPTVFSLRAAAIWALAQIPPLVATVWVFKRPLEIAEILGAYSTFTAFALLVYWLQVSERSARRALAGANLELLGSRALIVEGVRQAERLRIARDLHDHLGHVLTALRVQLELAGRDPDVARSSEAVDRARDLSKEALQELRNGVGFTRDSSWLDFPFALQAMAQGLPGVAVEVPAEPLSVTDDVGQALFRCVQEAVTNSLKHSSGRQVWIKVSWSDPEIEVTVRDDGRAPKDFALGFGLQSIQARAGQLGGRADFGPDEAGGFRVRVVVPVGAS